MVLLVMLASAYLALRTVPKSPFCTLNISLMERVLVEALSSLSLQKRVEVNIISCGQQRHGLQLQSPVSGTRGWVLPHLVLLEILHFIVYAEDH